MDKQLREAIENILTDDDVEYQYILDEGFGKDKATTAFRDLRVRTTDDLLALFHTYGNRERVDECKKLKKMCKRRDTQISDNTFVACVFESEIEQRLAELNREVES